MTQGLERRIDSIRLENLLSFKCAELKLRNLNVVIGPNGSGKSNLLTALEILRGTRGDFQGTVRGAGGIDLRWRGESPQGTSALRIMAAFDGTGDLDYAIEFEPGASWIREETLGYHLETNADALIMERRAARAYAIDEETTPVATFSGRDHPELSAIPVNARESALSAIRDIKHHFVLTLFGDGIETIRTARPVSMGPVSPARAGQPVNEDETRLLDNSSNLALVLNNLASSGLHDKIDDLMSRFLSGYQRLMIRIEGGAIRLFLAEHGLRNPIPASRFSDGTLGFLRLIALVYEPAVPLILAIEEPEASLHPDAIRLIAEMLKDASQQKQILVTTHSPELVDALSDDPESIVVCEKDPDEGTQFRRLSSGDLEAWLERYTLGELWRKGEIGGNRW